MSRRKLVLFLALLISFMLVYSSIGYYLMSKPSAQSYIGAGLYSETGSLADYTGPEAPNVTIGEQLNWHVQVENHMGSIQLTRIIFRLSNSSLSPATETSPSNTTAIGESEVFIPNGDNGTVPFNWRIVSYYNSSGLTYLTLALNGRQVSTNVGAKFGPPPAGFRFIIEIWTLDDTTGSFQYIVPNGHLGTYLTKWFNLKP